MFAFTPPNGPETPISIDIHAASFSDFCKLVYEKTQVKIFYKDADVQKIAVSLSVNAMPLVDVVKMAIAGTELKVSVWNNQLVILNSESLVTDFPELIPEGSVHESKETSNYMEVRRADSRTVIKVGKQDRSKRNQLVNLKCKVLEAENDLPIIGATLYVTETQTGAISDIDGVVNFAIRAGKYNITIAFLGLETKKCQLIAYDNGSFEVSLRKASIDIGEVNVFADKQSSIVTRDPGMERITAKSVRELPTMIGERDILKISESLPGIVSVGEGASGVNVRGGNSDQNAFYLNGIPIYNTSHLFGFFPAINAEIVKDFSIFKGFIPLQYGGRLSSVFNVSTKPGNNKQFYAKGGITPITANLILETPIIKDKASLQLSMRSSFSDWVLKKIKAGAYSDSKSQFYDGSFAVNFDAGKTQNALFVYRSSDRFKYSTLTDYQYATTGVSFISKYSITDNIHNRISLIGSSYGFETSEMSNASTAFTHNYAINSLELKDDVSHFISENLQLEYGANIVFNAINRGKVK
ncbi:MAG: hypothetical protein RIS47_680, partial [Bacteroidota bacterium]